MDVLSQVIGVMRAGEPRSARIEGHAPWRQLYPPAPGTGFHVILQGSGWLHPSAGDPIPLGVGDVVLLPNGHRHGMADSRETPLVEIGSPRNVEFRLEPHTVSIGSGRSADSSPSTIMLSGLYPLDRTRCHPVVSDLPEVIHLPAHRGQHPSLRAAVDLLSVELEHPSIGADAVVSALLDTMWLYALRAWYQEHGTGDGWGPALHDPAISAALCRMHANPERQWTVEDLGAAAGLSRAAFARRFTTLVGQPPLGYLTWLRMSTAAQLLRDSDNPLGAVAKRVGYTSEFAFASAFKRTYGTAPGTYRRRLRKATSSTV